MMKGHNIPDRPLDEDLDEDLDLDSLLCPKCDFHVSSGFKQRVMTEAKATSERTHRRRIPLAITSAAAAIAVILLLIAFLYRHDDMPAPKPAVASVELPALSLSDTTALTTHSELMAESLPTKQEIQHVHKSSPKRYPVARISSDRKSTQESAMEETGRSQTIEGEMPMVSSNKAIDPDEVRVRLIETRRNAEIAYIERIRDEIEATQAYIAQLKTEEIVYQ